MKMSNITDLWKMQKARAPAGYQWSRSAILADELGMLHGRLAALGTIVSRQLDAIDHLLATLPDATGRAALIEAVGASRGSLLEADRMLSQERGRLEALREQRFESYGSDTPRQRGQASGQDVMIKRRVPVIQ